MDPARLHQLMDFWPARITIAAAELDIFSALADDASADEVAAARGTDPRATSVLLNALVALELVTVNQQGYRIAEPLREALLPGPRCIVPGFQHRATLWYSWTKLAEVVRTGQPTVDPYERDERPDEQVQSFIGAMAVGARMSAPAAVAALEIDAPAHVLDIGGGPGVYAEEFCRAHPGVQVTILDLPRVCEIARQRLASTEHAECISFITGEVRSVDRTAALSPTDGTGYDLVFSSNLIHSMDEEQVQILFARQVGWCRAGGRVAVKDFLMADDLTEPARGALFAVNMLVNTPGGRTYRWTEVEQWLRDAPAGVGGRKVTGTTRISLPDNMSGIVVAAVH